MWQAAFWWNKKGVQVVVCRWWKYFLQAFRNVHVPQCEKYPILCICTVWLQMKGKSSSYLCGWRAPPSPWRTWSARYRAWSRVQCPPGLGIGLWSGPGTSPACREVAPEPPLSGLVAPSVPRCCHRYRPWSRGWPSSAHNRRTAEMGGRFEITQPVELYL